MTKREIRQALAAEGLCPGRVRRRVDRYGERYWRVYSPKVRSRGPLWCAKRALAALGTTAFDVTIDWHR